MAIIIDLSLFQQLLSIQKERQLIMNDVSESLGIDISFSDEEVMKYALEDFQKAIERQLDSEVEMWMKSLFS